MGLGGGSREKLRSASVTILENNGNKSGDSNQVGTWLGFSIFGKGLPRPCEADGNYKGCELVGSWTEIFDPWNWR